MFQSTLTIQALFESVKNDSDIAVAVTNDTLLFWYNELIRFLYLDLIKDDIANTVTIEKSDDGTSLSLTIPSGVETIKAVICEGYPTLERVSALYSLGTARPCYYEYTDNEIKLRNISRQLETCTVVTLELPEKITLTTSSEYVPLPDGFCELAKFKLLGEMYNASNDNDLSAKYFGFYNTLLADFKSWLVNYYKL